ncbi:MAG: prephenate dehydrogenase/arogenate dehydrogenase family protein [Burkholderiales bacterium]
MAATHEPAFRRVALLGVGLIGGSVAAAARASGCAAHVAGHAMGDDAAQALALGLIDSACESVADAVRGADLVVLAAPVPALPDLFRALVPHLEPQALITDCASTKASTVAAAREALGAAFARFVPAHPIAGSERHGPSAARADLFQRAVAVVCPHAGNGQAAVASVSGFWRALGARVVELDPARHDRVFAEVSHWPHALVFALCAAIARGECPDDALRMAGAGLRDTTRIGASAPALWADILLDNREPVLRSAAAFQAELEALLADLRGGDRDALIARFEAASAWRRALG